MKPTTLSRLSQWMGIHSDEPTEVSSVVIDSRQAGPGSLFVALPGQRTDGHNFAAQALEQGASVLVSRPEFEGKRVLKVADTLTALQSLARSYLKQHGAKVVAVTGSNGKTTTKDMTAAVLSSEILTHSSHGNFNNEIGLPLSILAMDGLCDVLVLEMGMRGPGQISALTDIAPPDVGVITNIGPVHLELLGSLDAVADAKGEMLQAVGPKGIAVLNKDDALVREQWRKHRCPVLWTSAENRDAGLYASDVSVDATGRAGFTAHFEGDSSRVQLPVAGTHNISNALLALGAGICLGVDLDCGTAALTAATISPRRLDIYPSQNGCLVINDAYNASPASMRSAMETAAMCRVDGQKLAVVGDMLELGEECPRAHRELGGQLAAAFDTVLFVGRYGGFVGEGLSEAGFPSDRFFWVAAVSDAEEILKAEIKSGDLVLLKGSRGVELERLEPLLERNNDHVDL